MSSTDCTKYQKLLKKNNLKRMEKRNRKNKERVINRKRIKKLNQGLQNQFKLLQLLMMSHLIEVLALLLNHVCVTLRNPSLNNLAWRRCVISVFSSMKPLKYKEKMKKNQNLETRKIQRNKNQTL